MSRTTENLGDGLLDYLQGLSAQGEHPAQAGLREATAPMKDARMQISVEQARFMAWLVGSLGVTNAIEVGTFTGYSALSVALALPEDGNLVACDVSKKFTDVGIPFWEQAGVAHKIDLRLGQAADSLQALLAEGRAAQFDFAFVDADKAAYPNYVKLCSQLLRVGGVLALDNAFLGGRVAHPPEGDQSAKVMQRLNAELHDSAKYSTSLVPISDGLLLARKLA